MSHTLGSQQELNGQEIVSSASTIIGMQEVHILYDEFLKQGPNRSQDFQAPL